MSNDHLPPLARPFSRPTRPAGITAIQSPTGSRPTMRTPYSGSPAQPEVGVPGGRRQPPTGAGGLTPRVAVTPASHRHVGSWPDASGRARVELVTDSGAMTDYPDDPVGSPDEGELFGWNAGDEETPERHGAAGHAHAEESYAAMEARDRAASLLEELAWSIRAGEVPHPDLDSVRNPEGVLAVVLAALLRKAGTAPPVVSERSEIGFQAP